jgi:antitoxin CptB
MPRKTADANKAADNRTRDAYIIRSPARPGFRRYEEQMTGMGRSSNGLDDRRRKLLFRSWHRGTREMDLILGRFADTALAGLTQSEVDEYERLMDAPDPDLYAWITGERPTLPAHDSDLLRRIREFHSAAQP